MEEKTAATTTSSAVRAVAALGEPQLLAAAALGACAGERTTTLMTEIKGVGTGAAMPTQRVPAIPDVAATAADASGAGTSAGKRAEGWAAHSATGEQVVFFSNPGGAKLIQLNPS